ncbi:MAG: divalent-cation tolerance protein CutA [Thermoguttaceae bacterium]|jgi:periplasmic divalent cation tolerance protein
MSEYIEVITTTESRDDAQAIGQALVDGRLAACAQIVGPVTSIYRWQGKINTTQEWQFRAKTRRELYDRVEETIRRLHPYQVPEIISIALTAGSADYLAWLAEETKNDKC